jgi:DNA-binding FadR family transcriptional regulator
VKPIEESSLEVVGRLLALEAVPAPDLVDQVLTVMNALLQVATEQALERASDDELDHARALIRRLRDPDLAYEVRIQTRLDLGRQFMRMSGNLVLGLIAHSLRVQIFGNAAALLRDYIHARTDDQEPYLERLEAALSSRDVDAAVATLQALGDLNREQVLNALRAARATGNGDRKHLT